MNDKLLIVGICGTTCAGKTTLANQLVEMLPNTKTISQDNYFLDVNDERHTWIPELKHINFDILSSLDMDKMYEDICRMKNDKSTLRNRRNSAPITADEDVNKLSEGLAEKLRQKHVDVLIVEGISIFNYPPLIPLFDLKYYLTLDRVECQKRRNLRVYEPPDCPGYFEKCAWPEHLKQLKQVQETVENVQYIDQNHKEPLKLILVDMLNILI